MKLIFLFVLMSVFSLSGCSPDKPEPEPVPETSARPARTKTDRSAVSPAPESIFGAAAAGQLDRVKEKLEQGDDINARDAEGVTALAWASIRGRRDIIAYLLEQGASPDIPDNTGLTALHKASLFGNADIIRLLIDNDANVNAEGPQGLKPIDVAKRMNHDEAIEILKAAGAVD